MSFKTDSELTLAGFVGFAAIGKGIAWLGSWIGIHAELLAGISYIFASAAAIMSFYNSWKKRRGP